jgi:hypothetical protein
MRLRSYLEQMTLVDSMKSQELSLGPRKQVELLKKLEQRLE